ncbi:hypothetical protein BROUX41_000739 [Berkeleyomyces rouxiae]|uniref:uncharacterized protein n=1 Tax=Berkeleyomyces rouxiae TaxID=2035830 RepID=UPI003B7DBA93
MRASFLATLAWATLIQAGCFRGICSTNSFDLTITPNPDWMQRLPDDVEISALSIPGTHDSMTFFLGGKDKYDKNQCQNANLKQQLESGIRYIDISARRDHSEIRGYAGNDLIFKYLGDVLLTIMDFLDEHPGEGLIMRLHRDSWPIDNYRSFERVIASKYLASNSPLCQRVRKHLYTHKIDGQYKLPKLGGLRGKVLILQDFSTTTPGRFGIPWKSDTMVVSDWKVATKFFGLSAKWEAVESSLMQANIESKNKLHITHNSINHGIDPHEAAGGPMENKQGMNDRLADFLELGVTTRIGIVVMDFPGDHLAQQIIKMNTPPYAPSSH